jgi:hypothetical protein
MRKESRMGTERQVMQDYLDALVKRADFPLTSPTTSSPHSKGPISAPTDERPPGS